VFDWEDGVGELSMEVVGRARAAAVRLPASRAWEEAVRAARFLAIGVEAEDLERRIRAGVVCWHSKVRSVCCKGCRCAWNKVLACRRRSVAIPPGSVEVLAAALPSKKRVSWYLQRAEGKAAMASFLGLPGPRIEEEQWWGRRAQARRTEPAAAGRAAGAQEAGTRGRKRAAQQEGGGRRKAASGQRHLHLLSETESRVAGTLLSRKVYLVNPRRGLNGSWLPACLQRDDFEETWWRGGMFVGAGEEWAVRHGFAEVTTSGPRRAPAAERSSRRRLQAYFAEQRLVSTEESLRRSAAAEAVSAALRDTPALDAPLPASWEGSARQEVVVVGRMLGNSLVKRIAMEEAARVSKQAVRVVRREVKRAGLVREARIELVTARRVQELAIAPLREGVRVSLGVAQGRSRALGAAKRKLEAAIADADEQPRASSRGARLAGLALAKVKRKLVVADEADEQPRASSRGARLAGLATIADTARSKL
jgi:hypothetical protein